MKLTDEQIKAIHTEYSQWKDGMYANRTLSERKDFGQFFTPPELSIKMLEKFENNPKNKKQFVELLEYNVNE